MMDYIRQLRVAGRRSWTQVGTGGSSRPGRRRASCALTGWEPLERRELLSTTQNFTTPGTAYKLQKFGGLPAATVQPPPPGNFFNFLRLATTPTSPASVNDNAISFATSDPGTYNQATASWDFSVTPQTGNGNGVGMSFALLNTANYGTSDNDPASSSAPQQGLYNGSLAFGFDTAADEVNLSMNGAVVTTTSLLGQINLARSGQLITANAAIDFLNARVSLSLTSTISISSTQTETVTVTVFGSTTVPGLAPYESRVSLEAKNNTATGGSAEFDLDNINVQMGTSSFGIQFEHPSYTALENQEGPVQIAVIRSGSMDSSETVSYVTADGTAKSGVNYTAVASTRTFGIGQALLTFTIPLLDDHLDDGNKTVNLYIGQYLGNPAVTAPLGSPIVATLTIVNTDLPAPTVSPTVQFLYAPHTRRVTAFRLQFSQPMDPTSAQTVSNYEVLLPPAHKNGPVRVVSLSQAVLDPSGLFVTLYRASLGQHLTNLFQIVVRGKPPTGLRGTNGTGTFLAGTGGVSGTDAVLTVSV